MARHLMAVCVVCLLCADHLPCKQHFEETANTQKFVPDPDGNSIADQRYVDTLHLPNGNQRHFEHSPYLVHKRRGRTKHSASTFHADDVVANDVAKDPNRRRQRRQAAPTQTEWLSSAQTDTRPRTKRHAGHHHDEPEDSTRPSEYFIRKLFENFGDSDKQTMNVTQFEKMMSKLQLYRLLGNERDEVEKSTSTNDSTMQCITSTELVKRVSSEPDSHHQTSPTVAPPNTPNSTGATTSQSPVNGGADVQLNAHDLAAICPILLYQLTATTSLARSGCIDPHLIAHDFGHTTHQHGAPGGTEDRKMGE